jgi:transcriptional regulator with GAF, ATPase, and Fis domain
VLESIGRGGMARVHLVEDEPRGVRLVIKELAAREPELLERFRGEFALLSRMSSPFLTRVEALGSERVRGEVVHFYVAEWIAGRSLATLLDTRDSSRTLPWQPALLDALEGLEALHALGMRHGDVSADNVMLGSDGRGVLIDLGCAAPFDLAATTVSGTDGYVAPELLRTGRGDQRADLFSVGVLLGRLYSATGTAPAPKVAALVERLVSVAPERRPSSVRDVLEAFGRRGSARGVRILGPELVGREVQVARFEEWLAGVEARGPEPRVFLIHGPPGVGTTRLLRELVGRAQLSLQVLQASPADRSPIEWMLGAASGSGEVHGVASVVRAVHELGDRREPLLLALADADGLGPEDAERLAMVARSIPAGGRIGLVVTGTSELPGVNAVSIAVPPLDIDALRVWTRGAVSERALSDALAATGGLPARVESWFERGARSVRTDKRTGTSLAPIRGLERLGPRDLNALGRVLALGGAVDPLRWDGDRQDWAACVQAGILVRDGASIRLADRSDAARLAAALPRGVQQAAHRDVAEALLARPVPDADRARTEADVIRHLSLAGSVADAERRLFSALPMAEREPSVFAARLGALLDATCSPDVAAEIGRIALLAQGPRQALSAAARALRLGGKGGCFSARLLAADALIRLGDGLRAEATVKPIAGLGAPGEVLARVARARMQRGEHASAQSIAEQGLAAGADGATRVMLSEVAGVSASYLGKPLHAEAIFTTLIADGADVIDASLAGSRDRCRLLGQRAIARFRAGRIAEARADYADALAVAERAGLDDLLAVCALNLGTSEQQGGELGSALASYERGLGIARAVGRISTELTLRYNLANLRAEIGAFDAALSDLDQLSGAAAAQGMAHFMPAIALLSAEIACLTGDRTLARQEVERAERAYGEQGLDRERIEVELLRAEIDVDDGATDAGRTRVEQALARAAELGAVDLELRAELVWARSVLAEGAADGAAALRVERAAQRARRQGQSLLEAKLSTELAALAEAAALPRASELTELARRAWDRLARDLPAALRDGFYRHPRRLALSRRTRARAVARDGHDAEALRRLLSLTRRLNSSLSLDRVLDYAVDAAVELTRAERGFLLLSDQGEAPRIAAARDGGDAGEPPSSSVVARALESEAPVLTTDAQTDPRFRERGSVHAMRLKSVLCVPILTPRGALGALYVDSRVQRGRFGEADIEMLSALADHAAIAVGNARLHVELERKAQQLADQKRTIERLSRTKDRQIERLLEQVEVRRRALEFRYDYSQIVGRGPAMRAVLSQVDRVVDSTVNVLIQGESGTGKELVARALHFNGPRKAGPFVGVNCAALPETLLESELFGHVRGAFTGADRDRVGLMREADGGTLFLDELGEMPVSTQSKLLRVIQERTVRPLGAEHSVKLDVRLVCATHKDLGAEVSAGSFREDLYYRVAVVTLRLPPLRERVEDLPELVQAILERIAREAGRPAPRVDAAVLRRLAAHRWPGNVRELENTLTRACVLSTGPVLTVADLDLATAAPRRRSTTRTDFEVEERARILETLRATRWNVSLVSRTLGIPRNTLYRRLVHYGLERGARQDSRSSSG